MSSAALELNHPLWQYSLRVYPLPQVAALCLQLQDEYGLNVNLLLVAGWAASVGRSLSSPDFEQLQRAIAPLHSRLTQPLRTLRRQSLPDLQMPAPWHSEMKQRLLTAELFAEQVEQAIVYTTLHSLELTAAVPAIAGQERSNAGLTAGHAFLQENVLHNLKCYGAIATPQTILLPHLTKLAALMVEAVTEPVLLNP